ncbi:MAG TPA: hypothetical protein VNO33_13525 [Kofleriaceae bacterium]|nr:hypothetical protein [Kofleriaceae bacterium]
MHETIRSHARRGLLVAAMFMQPAPRADAAPPEPCTGPVVKCTEEALGVDLEVDEDLSDGITLGSRLVIYWWEDDCEYRQVVIVTVANLPHLQDIMRRLPANKWNAMGEVSRDDYRQALASGALFELFAEPPEPDACKQESLPPCELPGDPIVIEVIGWPDEDILLHGSLEPVTNPKFCFSIDLERGPIIGPVPEVMVPFFFLEGRDVKRVRELLNPR